MTVSKKKSERINGRFAKMKDEYFNYQGNAPYLEKMGVDSLVFDEAHHFKNSVHSNNDRVKYINAPNESKRGADAQAKAWYIRGLSPLKDGVQLLTATPVTNSPIEIYSMLSLAVGRDRVNQMFGGINGVDDFVRSVCDIGTEEVAKLAGGYGNVDCLQGLKNLAMLKNAINGVATMKNADDVKGLSVVIPDRDSKANSVQLDDDSLNEIDTLKKAYEQARAYEKSGNGKDLGEAYWTVKNRYREPNELIAHPFNLLTKMSQVILDKELGELCSFYDFDDEKLAQKVVDTYNQKPVTEKRSRLGVHTANEDYTTEYDKETGDIKAYKTTVRAKIIKNSGRSRIMLDSTDYRTQQKFEALCEKMGLNLSVTIPAKIAALLENIKAEMANKRGKKDDGTTSGIVKQIVFCDELALHSKLVRLISEQCGVAKAKITIITGQVNSSVDEIQEVQDGFNAMDDDNVYQIIIANEKAEVGINLQKGTQAIHHLTTGWTPDSLEQRNGRGARQGNHTEQVHIYYYDAAGTFDSIKREMIDRKSDWIGSLFDKDSDKEHLSIKGELSMEEKELLIDTMGDETKLQEQLAKMQQKEAQRQRENAEFEQMTHFDTMVKQQKVLATTLNDEIDEWFYANFVPKATELVKTKIIFVDRFKLKTVVKEFDEKQQKAYDAFSEVFYQALELFNVGQELLGIPKLPLMFIEAQKDNLGANTDNIMGNKSNNWHHWFYRGAFTAVYHAGYNNNPDYLANKDNTAKADSPVAVALAEKQAMAKRLIESAANEAGKIADKYDGLNRELAGQIKDGKAKMMKGRIFALGDVLYHQHPHENGNDKEYCVVSKFNADGFLVESNRDGSYGDSKLVADEFKKVRKEIISYGVDEFRKVDSDEYLNLIKDLANKTAQDIADGRVMNTLAKLLPDVMAYIKDNKITYETKLYGNKAIDTEFGVLLEEDVLNQLDDAFISWYDKHNEKYGITRISDGDYVVYTVPGTMPSDYAKGGKNFAANLVQKIYETQQFPLDKGLEFITGWGNGVLDLGQYRQELRQLGNDIKDGKIKPENAMAENLTIIDRLKTVNASNERISQTTTAMTAYNQEVQGIINWLKIREQEGKTNV